MGEYAVRRDKDGRYYWILRSTKNVSAKNFRPMAVSVKTYDTKDDALRAIAWTRQNADTNLVRDEAPE